MVSLFLIISFLIHILTLIIVFNFLKQLTQLKNKNANEMEQLLSTYLQEIKNENRRLQQELSRKNPPSDKVSVPKSNDKNHAYKALKDDERLHEIEGIIKNNDKVDSIETSIEAKALQLYNQGNTITEIAQKLNRGKTEVSLIIELTKLRNQ